MRGRRGILAREGHQRGRGILVRCTKGRLPTNFAAARAVPSAKAVTETAMRAHPSSTVHARPAVLTLAGAIGAAHAVEVG